MNIVFWLLVVIAAVALWYYLSDRFFKIGSGFRGMIDNVKGEVNKTEDEQEENEE